MTKEKKSRSRLYGFILFNVIEEVIIASIAFILLSVFASFFLIPGMIIVGVGLVIFTAFKIYYYWTSTSIPVYDPLIGKEGVALIDFKETELGSWNGKVRVQGEEWKAQANEAILHNSRVWVHRVEGLSLYVTTTPPE
jgi:membrane-bound ClpP family serine protease